MLRAIRNKDDLLRIYNIKKAVIGSADRTITVYLFKRQPRPHMMVEVSAMARCRLFQPPEQHFATFEHVMDTRRKGVFNAFRENWLNL